MQIIEFSPSPLEDEQVKVYFSILTWGRTERGGETISFLNVYKYVLLFFFHGSLFKNLFRNSSEFISWNQSFILYTVNISFIFYKVPPGGKSS